MAGVRSFVWVMLACLGVLCGALNANAENTPSILFVEESDWPPFTPDHFGLAEEGMSYDLMSEIMTRTGLSFSLELYPMQRVLELLKRGKADAATVISKNEQRSEFIVFSDPIFQKRGLIWFNKRERNLFEWTQFSDLKGLSIGIVRGHNYGDEFHQAVADFGLNTVEVTRVEQSFAMLKAGRLDVVLSTDIAALGLFKNPSYKGIFGSAEKPYYAKHYHIGFSKESSFVELMPQINQSIAEARKAGTLQSIVEKYIGFDE